MSEEKSTVLDGNQQTEKRGGVNAAKLHERLLIEMVRLGGWEIDKKGRIWTVRRRNTGNMIFRPVKRVRAEKTIRLGYLRVRAYWNGRRISCLAHRLVWQFHFGDIPRGMTVNHKNGKKGDNRPTNLELATQQDNCLHAAATGLRVQIGETHSRVKLTDAEIAAMRSLYAAGNHSQPEIARIFGVCALYVGRIVRGKWRRKAGGPITKLGRVGHRRFTA